MDLPRTSPDAPPSRSLPGMGDHPTGMSLFGAIMAALYAFAHDQTGERYERTVRINGRDVATVDQLFWAGYPGAVYLPATVAPIGFTPAKLPVGVQIVGAQYADRTCIDVARLLEREYEPFVPPPGYE